MRDWNKHPAIRALKKWEVDHGFYDSADVEVDELEYIGPMVASLLPWDYEYFIAWSDEDPIPGEWDDLTWHEVFSGESEEGGFSLDIPNRELPLARWNSGNSTATSGSNIFFCALKK